MARLDRSWKTDKDGAALATELHRVLEISHRQAKGLIDAGCVKVNGQEARTYGHRLKENDELAVAFDPGTSYQPQPRPSRSGDAPFDLLWEDTDLVFVNKPAGLLTVPAEKGNEATLADALTESYRRRGIKRVQIYVVHRLDRWTSGVLVFGKTPEALHGLKAMFEEHKLQRVYKAILAGELPENSGTLSGRIVENPKSLRMRVVKPRQGDAKPKGTKEAVTHYRVLERLPGHTLVEVKLETGRRNQIRVQFADRGYPLLGDQVYGQTSDLLDRQALHAELLGFKHPVTGDAVSVSAPLPPDMEAALKALRLRQRLTRAEAGTQGEKGIFRPRITEERKLARVHRSKRFSSEDAGETRPPVRERAFPPRGPRKDARPGEDRPHRPKRPSPGGPREPQGDARPQAKARTFGARGPRQDAPHEGRAPRPKRPAPQESREAPGEARPQSSGRAFGHRGAREEGRPGGHRKPSTAGPKGASRTARPARDAGAGPRPSRPGGPPSRPQGKTSASRKGPGARPSSKTRKPR
jgi:23S rRNA pseudouridine1911/1915/1917 synthase